MSPDCTGQWFDGYDKHEDVIFDDMDVDTKLPRALFLKLFDRYPMKVPVKGGFRDWVPKRVFITSNDSPQLLYPSPLGEVDPAVKRRLTAVFQT
jgi:hypothetical protein